MKKQVYGNYLISLIKSAFLNDTPSEMPDDISLGQLFKLSMFHNITNILYLPLKHVVSEVEALAPFEKIYKYKMQNDAIQSVYLEKITDEFEKNGIIHCVMKGPVIKPLYPRSDYRQSGDIDIYIDENMREKSREIMEKLGFSVERYNLADADDAYTNGKLEVELHRVLISNKTPWQKECQKIADRLVLKTGKQFEYEMSREDYYLYMIAHMAKHMKYSGMGIKMVLDVWVYMDAYKDTLNWDILKSRLDSCGLTVFEENLRKLVGFWFCDAKPTQTIQKLSDYIILSGTFGTDRQLKATEIAENTKGTNNKFAAQFVSRWKMIFKPYKWMAERYKILKSVPILLPFCWADRLIKALLDKNKTQELMSHYDGVDLDEGKRLQAFKKEIGL